VRIANFAARLAAAARRTRTRRRYTIPFNEFRCTKFGRSEANRITFENPNAGENDLVTFCIDSLKV
jgi:hypothetical protein